MTLNTRPKIDYSGIEKQARSEGIKKHAVCAVIFKEGKVLLVKRSLEDKIRAGEWELPGGKVEPKEGFREALIRETKEETNLNVTDVERYVGHADATIQGNKFRLYMFVAKADDSQVILRPREHENYEWVPTNLAHKYLVHDDFTELFLSYLKTL